MATLTRGYTFGATEEVTNAKLHALVDSASISSLGQSDIASGSGIAVRSTTAPSDTDAIWVDTSASVIKWYRGSEWVIIGAVHVGTAAMSSPQDGDLWYDTSNNLLKVYNGSTWDTVNFTPTAANALAGSVVQTVNTQVGTYAAGSTGIPWDDTIPQNTEGDEVMTLAITPTSASNKLKIEVIVNAGASAYLIVALFQGTTANALAAAWSYTSTNESENVKLTHYMTAGTTSATTFKVRAGAASGSGGALFNGADGSARFGGVSASSITIQEIKV